MALKSKFFRIAVEGDTTDGRVIDRNWIEEIVEGYSPEKYGARVNCEHINGIMPDGPFGAYGDVISVKSSTVTIDGEEKLALMGAICPTEEMIALSRKRKKVYPSAEIDPNFSNSGKAYLVGLAMTDRPASLGTEMMLLASQAKNNPLESRKQNPRNVFTASTHEVTIEFSNDESLLDKVKGMFNRNNNQQQDLNQQVSGAIELIAQKVADIEASHGGGDNSTLEQKIAQLSNKLTTTEQELSTLKGQLEETPNFSTRPPADGGQSQHVTDC